MPYGTISRDDSNRVKNKLLVKLSPRLLIHYTQIEERERERRRQTIVSTQRKERKKTRQ